MVAVVAVFGHETSRPPSQVVEHATPDRRGKRVLCLAGALLPAGLTDTLRYPRPRVKRQFWT
jgi:hypothetical protein